MKKTGICKFASLLIWGLFFTAATSFARPDSKVLAKKKQMMLSDMQKSLGVEELVQIDAIPPAKFLSEPVYTEGDTNIVYWRRFPEAIQFTYNGDDYNFSPGDGDIFIRYGVDRLKDTTKTRTITVRGDLISAAVSNRIVNNEQVWGDSIYYVGVLMFKSSESDLFFISNLDSSFQYMIHTIHDSTKPVLDALSVRAKEDALHNGWFNTGVLDFSYYGLDDPAGLYTACLKLEKEGDVDEYCQTLLDSIDGRTGPGNQSDTLTISTLTSGVYRVWLQACDAAYTPESHGTGEGVEALWRIEGNCVDNLAKTEVRIDLDAPFIDFSLVKNPYTDSSLTAEGTFRAPVILQDSLSGVDRFSINLSEDSDILFIKSFEISGADDSMLVDVEIGGVPETGLNERFYLKVSVADLAGNNIEDSTLITVNIDPVKFTFHLFDPSPPPDSAQPGFTNEAVVMWAFDSTRFDEKDVDKVVFYTTPQRSDSVVWNPGVPKILDLRDLFGELVSNSLYTEAASVTLKNGLRSDADDLPTASIYFDDTPPVIDSFRIWDDRPSPLPASPGFANSDTVSFRLVVTEADSVDSLVFKGDTHDTTMFAFIDSGRVTLTSGDAVSKRVLAAVRDRAGNRSVDKGADIKLVKQAIEVNIVPDTVGVSTIDTVVIVPVKISCDYPPFLRRVFTRSDTLIFEKLDKDGEFWMVPLPVFSDGFNTVSVSDSSGSLSNTDTLYFDIQTPPTISLTLYDYSEFGDSTAVFDSMYTDELNETEKIVAVLKRLQGAWIEVKIAFDGQDFDDVAWQKVDAHSSTFVYETKLSDENLRDCQIFMQAVARNRLGKESPVVVDAILHDVTPPQLTDFTAISSTGDMLAIHYDAQDEGDCRSGVAGIVVRDSVDATGETKWMYWPVGYGEIVLTPIEAVGLHHLREFVVDSADVDQGVGELSGKSLQELAELWRHDRGGLLGHPSNALEKIFNWQHGPHAAGDIAYNYPNPFNPENGSETTAFYLPVDQDTRVDLRIFDLFGHLVREQPGVLYKVVAEAGASALQWNGRNGRNELVASGAYLAIITLANGETLKPIKIGVLRKN